MNRTRTEMPRLREISGLALVIAGLIGCLIPVIPGTPMVIAGVALLGTDHPTIRSSIQRMKEYSDLLARGWRLLLRRSKA